MGENIRRHRTDGHDTDGGGNDGHDENGNYNTVWSQFPSLLCPSVPGPSVLAPSVLCPSVLCPFVLCPFVLCPSVPCASVLSPEARPRRADWAAGAVNGAPTRRRHRPAASWPHQGLLAR